MTPVTEAVPAPSPAPPAPVLLDTGPSARGAHRLQSALTCEALYAFTRVLKHEEALGDRGPLVRGSIGHVALAHHYARIGCEQHGLPVEGYHPPHDAIDLVATKMAPLGNQFRPLIHRAYDAYAAYYAVERMEVVGVECPIDHAVPMPQHLIDRGSPPTRRFTQRWDLLRKDDAGRYWITDHKFVAKVEPKTVARYALSIQFTSMVWLGHTLFGAAFGGVKLNLVGVGNGQFHFQQPTLPPSPEAVRRFPETLDYAERRIESVEALADPWDAPRVYSEQVCMTPYGACPAAELCRWGRGHLTMDGRTL